MALSPVTRVGPHEIVGALGEGAFDVLPDGRLVGLMPPVSTEGSLSSVRYVVNWFEELQKLVPVK